LTLSEAPPGRNGVAITRHAGNGAGYRTYEVHQRERVGESTAQVKPAQLIGDAFARDPYPVLAILREHYPCYRNWLTNAYWVTRYDDVTSIFVDDANFETRPKRWFYGQEDYGADLGQRLEVLQSHADHADGQTRPVTERLVAELCREGSANLATDFAARLPLELLVGWLDVPADRVDWFVTRYWQTQRGVSWEPRARDAGRMALLELGEYFELLLHQRRATPGSDLVSVIAGIDTAAGPARGADVAVTLLEWDHATLHGGLANLCYLLLTHPQALAAVREDPHLLKSAYLEALRHSAPVLMAQRYTRHEVERFGRLLPEGALVVCSAAAANRDPRIFVDPDQFVFDRRDLCQREARGQYRADGLASGVCFGLGKPSKHPAVPEDRPRSLYALTRDTAVTAASVLLEMAPRIESIGEPERPRSQRLGEIHCCWNAPVHMGR
jgi:cytochrome P450